MTGAASTTQAASGAQRRGLSPLKMLMWIPLGLLLVATILLAVSYLAKGLPATTVSTPAKGQGAANSPLVPASPDKVREVLQLSKEGPINFTAGKVELPADFLLPPGATIVLSQRVQANDATLLIEALIPGDKAAASAFFRDQAQKNGWTVRDRPVKILAGSTTLLIDRGAAGQRMITLRDSVQGKCTMAAWEAPGH
jgi:hypothetical protein